MRHGGTANRRGSECARRTTRDTASPRLLQSGRMALSGARPPPRCEPAEHPALRVLTRGPSPLGWTGVLAQRRPLRDSRRRRGRRAVAADPHHDDRDRPRDERADRGDRPRRHDRDRQRDGRDERGRGRRARCLRRRRRDRGRVAGVSSSGAGPALTCARRASAAGSARRTGSAPRTISGAAGASRSSCPGFCRSGTARAADRRQCRATATGSSWPGPSPPASSGRASTSGSRPARPAPIANSATSSAAARTGWASSSSGSCLPSSSSCGS